MSSRHFGRAVLQVSLLLSLLLVLAVEAGGPEYVIFYGKTLEKPAVIPTWWACHDFMLAIQESDNVTDTSLAKRPSLEVALFWGNWWRARVKDADPAETLRQAEADQKALFYPAYQGAAAVIVFTASTMNPGIVGAKRSISESGLELLKRYGVPIGVE